MIVLDLEWNRGYDKTPLEEILQIGAVKLDKLGGTITDTFCIFVHPCVHRKLNRTAKTLPELHAAFESPYDFPSAVKQFRLWCGDDTVFADWGGDAGGTGVLAVDANSKRLDHTVPPAGHTAVGTQCRGDFASQITVVAVKADGTVRCFGFIIGQEYGI